MFLSNGFLLHKPDKNIKILNMLRLIRYTLLILVASSLFAHKILFDYTKDETAGNADWIVDDSCPVPYPYYPDSATDWKGAISSWGFELYHYFGDTIRILHNYPITYNDSTNPLDLSNFDVYIVPEPQDQFTALEKEAILNFVAAGGGLFCISDHNSSDRNGNGWDSPRVWNDFGTEEYFGVHFDTTGESPNSISETSYDIVNNAATSEIVQGPYGNVVSLAFHAGDCMVLYTSANCNVQGIVQSSYGGYWMSVISRYGNGKVALIGDSSPCDDGNGNQQSNLYDGWGEATDSILFINLTLWLSGYSRIEEYTHKPAEQTVPNLLLNSNDVHTVLPDAIFFDITGRLMNNISEKKGVFLYIKNGKKGRVIIQ